MLEMIKNVCTVIAMCEIMATFAALITIVVENRKDRRDDNDDKA